jgi:chemotaxis family two-component system sensor kinase Cph1
VKLAAGYRVASQGSQVGGDWYDAFALHNGRVALVVGDAAGHGVQAATVMAQLRNALRADLFESVSPAESLDRVSRFLAAQEPDAFATVVCLEIDQLTGDVVWASAGHPAPVLVRRDGTSAYLKGRPAPPMGWSERPSTRQVPQHRLTIETGDRLILFSDGLLERRGVNLEIGLAHLMLVAEQTRNTTDPAEVCEAILRDMLADAHDDDVCLLVADFRTRSQRRTVQPDLRARGS